MKKCLLLIPLLLCFCSCSNEATITAKYMSVYNIEEGDSTKKIFVESSTYDIQVKFTFERKHVLTKEDLSSMEKEACEAKPREYLPDKPWPPTYHFYDFSFDLERENNLTEGYVLKKDILVYYSVFISFE